MGSGLSGVPLLLKSEHFEAEVTCWPLGLLMSVVMPAESQVADWTYYPVFLAFFLHRECAL